MAAPTGRTPILGLPYPTPDDDVQVPRDVQALAEAIDAGATFIVGEVRFIALAAPPARWLACDGAAVGRSAYAALYAAIGVTFGSGDGSTTFTLPDLRGRVPVGAGQGASLTMRAVGTKWGVEAVVLSTAQLPSHAHGGATGADSPDHTHNSGNIGAAGGSWGIIASGGSSSYGLPPQQLGGTLTWQGLGAGLLNLGGNTGGASARHAHTVSAEGGGANHDNTQPSLAVPAYIYAGA